MTGPRRKVRRGLLAILVVLSVILGIGHGDSVSQLQRTTAVYEQDLVRWEMTHFFAKWWHLAKDVFRERLSPRERLAVVQEFFAVQDDLKNEKKNLEHAVAIGLRNSDLLDLQARVQRLERLSSNLHADVEQTLEAVISGVVHELGIIDAIGPVHWPPVDFTFAPNGLVLVRSPRDRIERLDGLLLDHSVGLLQQVTLEEDVEALGDNISAIVVRIGGVATYPSQVTPELSLHSTLNLISHEWLHHWLFFRPLGRSWFAGGELTSVNETVANMFGEEVGDAALERLTGDVILREEWPSQGERRLKQTDPLAFDYRREMRQTRLHLEELLSRGEIDRAEVYLEERRLTFVANGFSIRKLNNAWFAFKGTYGDSPAAISPIEDQLRTIRADSENLAHFLDRVSAINQAGQLKEIAVQSGWRKRDAL
jgi:hypothetical protein